MPRPGPLGLHSRRRWNTHRAYRGLEPDRTRGRAKLKYLAEEGPGLFLHASDSDTGTKPGPLPHRGRGLNFKFGKVTR